MAPFRTDAKSRPDSRRRGTRVFEPPDPRTSRHDIDAADLDATRRERSARGAPSSTSRARLWLLWLTSKCVAPPSGRASVHAPDIQHLHDASPLISDVCAFPRPPAPRQFAKLQVQRSQRPLPKCPDDQLGFGKVITDHMLQVKWSAGKGWGAPRIIPTGPVGLHPFAHVFHYAIEVRMPSPSPSSPMFASHRVFPPNQMSRPAHEDSPPPLSRSATRA